MADKRYFRITAGVECEKNFYIQAQDKEDALTELEELNFLKEETVLFSGKIDVDVVDKEQDIVEVTSGQSTTVKASLSIAQPKIGITIDSAQSGFSTPFCYWEIRGTVTNTGDAVAKQMMIEATIDPDSSDYKETKKIISIGALSPGEARDYYVQIDGTPCVESTGKVKCTYIDAEDNEKSVSKSL